MANIYIWFQYKAERRKFAKTLIEMNTETEKVKRKAKVKNKKEEVSSMHLDLMEAGKTKSPYYNLHKKFYFGRVPEANQKLSPYNPIEVFKNGFRSIYYQNSYMYRPGNWLVIQLRKTNKAFKIKEWIMEVIPKERIGTNVPIPKEVLSKWKMEHVDKSLISLENNNFSKEKRSNMLKNNMKLLKEALEDNTDLFKGETIFLWERLGFEFYGLGELNNMEECLRIQADLQPGIADAFLNMGVFYNGYGFMQKALDVYIEGLQINPNDECIYYNVSSMLSEEGYWDYGFKMIEEAIKINQDRAINYMLKGDICYYKKEYKESIEAYEQSFNNIVENDFKEFLMEPLNNYITACRELDIIQKIKILLENEYLFDKEDVKTLIKLSNIYIDVFQDYKQSICYAEKILDKQPDSIQAYEVLMKYNIHINNEIKIWQYKKKLKELEKIEFNK